MNEKIKVLVAEDNPGDFSLLRFAAKSLPYTVELEHFKNGLDLLNYIECNCIAGINFIFLDINMPKVDGYEVLQFFSNKPGLNRPPIIMLSGSNNEQDIERCYQMGANGYIVKSINMGEFQTHIKSTIDFWGKLNVTAN